MFIFVSKLSVQMSYPSVVTYSSEQKKYLPLQTSLSSVYVSYSHVWRSYLSVQPSCSPVWAGHTGYSIYVRKLLIFANKLFVFNKLLPLKTGQGPDK